MELRTEAGVTQLRLAACAGIAQSYLWKIEHGQGQPSLETLTAIGACLGADLGVRYFPGTGPRIRDRMQAPMIEALLRCLDPHWRGMPEVPVPAARGVIDLVLTRERDRSTVVCECHSEVRRLELVLRRAFEKTVAIGPRFEEGRAPTTLLLLRSTEGTRAIAKAYQSTLGEAFPGRAADAFAALTCAEVAWPGSTLLWATVTGGHAEILSVPPRGVHVGR